MAVITAGTLTVHWIPRYDLKHMSVKKYQITLIHITTLSSAEKIRLWLQSNIEWIGKEVWVDIKRLNKNIAWGKALEKWLIQSMDRADNNNIFWLSDTQTALISSVLWWSPVDVALTLWWKSILENVWVRSNIAKSLYTKQFDEQRLVSKDSIVGSDNTAGGNISRQFANSNTSVNSSKSSDINQPSQTLPTKTKAPLVQSTKTAPKLPVATKTPLKQANESVNVVPKQVQEQFAKDATNPRQLLIDKINDNESLVKKVLKETNPTLEQKRIDDFIERAKQGRAGTDEMVKEILKKLDTPKLSPKTPKALKTPTPLSKVDDTLPVWEKMPKIDLLPLRYKLESKDIQNIPEWKQAVIWKLKDFLKWWDFDSIGELDVVVWNKKNMMWWYSPDSKNIILSKELSWMTPQQIKETLYEEAIHALRDSKWRSVKYTDYYIDQDFEKSAKKWSEYFAKQTHSRPH